MCHHFYPLFQYTLLALHSTCFLHMRMQKTETAKFLLGKGIRGGGGGLLWMGKENKGFRRRGLESAASRKATWRNGQKCLEGILWSFATGFMMSAFFPSFLQWPQSVFFFFAFAFTWEKYFSVTPFFMVPVKYIHWLFPPVLAEFKIKHISPDYWEGRAFVGVNGTAVVSFFILII